MKSVKLTWIVVLAMLLVGCDEDERAVRLATETAETAKRLVEADAKSRHELCALQRQLQSEQAIVGQQRDQLEAERRTIAEQRHRDPIVAAVLTDMGLVSACLAPLVVCIYLLRVAHSQSPTNAELAEVLTWELTTDHPTLLPPPSPNPAIGADRGVSLLRGDAQSPDTAAGEGH